MKKLLSLALALVMILSMSVTAFAASDVPSVLYIDVAGAMNSEKAIGRVGLFLSSLSGQGLEDETMTHVSGTIYSYDISSVLDPNGWARYTIYYADGTYEYQARTTVFESGKNLFTANDDGEGIWSVYEEAATPSVTNGSQNVTGKYVAGAAAATIYKIDISWGGMAFTFTSAGKGTWDTDDHTYKNATAAGWSWAEGANKITVTNHSNDGITVTPSYTPDSGYETATMAIAPAALSLSTADNGENGAAGTATNGTITVTPSGSIPEGTSGKIGQITLSISGQPVEVSDEEALVAALNAGRTAKLAGDFSVSNAITVSASSVLDLNGHTLTTSAPISITTGGSLTVMDSASGGKLTSTAQALENRGGTLVVNSGTIESSNNVVALYGGTTQLNGGAFHCTGSMFVVLVSSNLTGLSINGGSFTGGQYSIWNPYYSFTITGGTFEQGFFTPVAANAITVTGGTYSFDPTDYIDATVCYVQSNDDGTYTALPRDESTTVPINQNVNSLAKLTSVTKTGGTATLSSSLNGALQVTETQTLADGVELTLDLNGKKIQAAGSTSPMFSVPANTTLTLTDSGSDGSLLSLNNGTAIEVSGTLNVQSGKVLGNSTTQPVIMVNAYGKAEFSGGTAYLISSDGTLTLSNGSIDAVYVNGGTTTVSGGEVKYLLKVSGGTLKVTSGTTSVINATAGTVTVSGGTITGTISADGTSSITITGGTITGGLYQNGTGTLTIIGGTFSNDPSAYVPEGYTVTNNGDGTYTVTANS